MKHDYRRHSARTMVPFLALLLQFVQNKLGGSIVKVVRIWGYWDSKEVFLRQHFLL